MVFIYLNTYYFCNIFFFYNFIFFIIIVITYLYNFYYKFIRKHLLPYLGSQMEQEGKYSFSVKELRVAVNKACKKVKSNEFFDTFPFFIEYEEKLFSGKLEDQERKRFAELKKAMVDELAILVEEKDTYHFLHQNFRDFFAATHILNEIQTVLSGNRELPNLITASPISYYVVLSYY